MAQQQTSRTTTQSASGMNIEDVDMLQAERDAFPERYRSYDPSDSLEQRYEELHPQQTSQRQEPIEEAEESTFQEKSETGPRNEGLERTETQHTGSSSSSVSQRPQPRHRQPSTLSKTSTRFEDDMMHYLDRHPTAMKRIGEHRLQHSQTVGTGREHTMDGVELPDFGGNKPYPQPLPDREEYVVEFSGHDDPRHAQNWPLKKKMIIGAILIFDSLAATLASSIFSAASTAVGEEFHVGREVVTLGTSLFVLGYALGPMIFAPMSELYGRRLPIIIAAFGFGIFNTAVAVAKDYQTLMISRFFAGLFGACPLALTGAVFSDCFNNKTRGLAIACFSATIINGPFCGPMIGGFITKSYLGWRWVAWIPSFMGYAAGVLALFFQDESYGPVILVSKASELRRLTRNWGIHAKQEEVEVDFKELIVKNLSRPLRILFTEPIVLLVTLYMSFIYGILYLTLTAYELIFGQVHGFSLGVEGLPYMALIVGVLIAFGVVVFQDRAYARKLEANNNIPVPEWRMPIVMPGGILYAAGLFWLGWTGYTNSIPAIAPTCAGLFLGFGIFSVFLQCLNYIIDAYLMFAASAIAANTIMRSLFGAIFPLFATYMYEGIGIQWGNTLLGCVAVLFIPMPFIFYFYGKKIRARSKFAPAPDIEQDKRRAAQRDEEGKVGGDAGGESGSAGSDEMAQQQSRQEEQGQQQGEKSEEKKNE